MRAGRTPRARARAPGRCRRARRARRGRARAPARRDRPGGCRFRAAAGAGGELLPDHAQRQELVALQAQDRLEPLDVVLAEEPVAAARALRRQQALVLEVADLRDRDVRELGLQPRADRADRVQALLLGLTALCGCGGHRLRKVSRYLPIWTSSSSSSSADSIRFLLTKVPLRLPRSLIVKRLPVAQQLGVLARDGDVVEEDVALGRAADQRALAGGEEALPRPAAAGADDQRRPLAAEVLQRRLGIVGDLLGCEGHGLLTRLAFLEARAAARAEVGGLRVLEATLATVDVAQCLHALVGLGRAPRGEDVGERLDVDVGDALALQPRRALRAEDVDLAPGAGGGGRTPRSPPPSARRSASSGRRRRAWRDREAIP